VERYNSEGELREDLLLILQTPRKVLNARRIDTCILCRAKRVNESGLCVVCYSLLDGDELRMANRWMAGLEP
jgi:hypothetical protein